jgi:hypothetical protein
MIDETGYISLRSQLGTSALATPLAPASRISMFNLYYISLLPSWFCTNGLQELSDTFHRCRFLQLIELSGGSPTVIPSLSYRPAESWPSPHHTKLVFRTALLRHSHPDFWLFWFVYQFKLQLDPFWCHRSLLHYHRDIFPSYIHGFERTPSSNVAARIYPKFLTIFEKTPVTKFFKLSMLLCFHELCEPCLMPCRNDATSVPHRQLLLSQGGE